ncbi:MAG: dTDP-4-dehydrorhamnose 3,5-epimerase [Deferribacteraceae bacterium]|jgi:dTDP-4-dehydrorhamnose 3,5-epimerase|nr:dTDP-4-dehydrorhamnose 3,5-epimerase [Deferribacteraceae bacterium]
MIQKFSFNKTEIDGLILIKPFVAYDERGYFIKDYNKKLFLENGIEHELKEVFYAHSRKGVIRGIHFQRERQQAKLVRCISGNIYDVIVDLRKGSSTFGKWQGFELSEANKDVLYVPSGCGHGYIVLENAIVSYKCAEDFYGEYDDGIIWNDKDLNINWGTDRVSELTLSDKDKALQTFEEFKSRYGGLN